MLPNRLLKFIILVLPLILTAIFSGCGGITTPGIPQDTLSAVITANPTSGEAPLEVTFDASESSVAQGNEIVSYEWDFGDGKTGDGGTIQHGFDFPGNYTVILTISDNKGAIDTSSKIIKILQPTETAIEQNFNTQDGTEFDTNSGLKIIIPPTLIEGQVNLEVKYDSSPSQSASDFINLHSIYSISITPQKEFQEKELMTSGMNKDQETMKVSFIFDVPEDVDPQSLAIFEWTDEGWCLTGAGNIETIEQLGGVLSSDGTQISIEIPNFSNYGKGLNSKDLQDTLGSIKLSLCNFVNNSIANIPICPSILIKPEEKYDDYIKKEIEFRSLDLGVLGYGRGICYKVGVKNSENLISDPVWEQPYISDLIKIVDPFGEYLIPTNDWEKPGVLTIKFGTEGGECTVWLEANQGAIVKKWLLSVIPYVGPADVLWRNIIEISDAFNNKVLNPFFGLSIDDGALIKEIREMIKEVAMELIKEGLDNFIPVLTLGVSIGELNAGIITYQETVYNLQNPCKYKNSGYWEWKIIVLPITNNPPVANAGPDQTVQVGTLVSLDGTASYDNDGDTLSYKWTQINGPEIVNLSDSNISKPTFTPTKVGVYEFELIVNDGEVNSEPDNVIINVIDSGCTAPGSFTLNATSECDGTTSQIRLNWTNSSGVSSYEVYRNNTLYYSGLTGAQYINSGNITVGTAYSYYIIAKNSCGSTASNIVSATAISCVLTNLVPPTGLSVSSSWNTTSPGFPSMALSWNAVSGATGYEMWVRPSGGSYTSLGTRDAPYVTFNSNSLPGGARYVSGTTYYFKVCTVTASGTSAFTSEVPCVAVAAPSPSLGKVQLSSPGSGVTLPPGNITFSWNFVSNATKYEFILYNQQGQVALDTTYSSASATVALGTEETITWKVRAGDNSGNWGTWSDTWSLTLKSTTISLPDPPTSLSPGTTSAPGPIISTLTPTLQWQAVSNADYYNLSVSIYPYGTSNIIYYNQQIYGNSITVPSGELEAGKKYRWNMRAYNSAGYSDYSSDYYFQTG